MAARSYSTWITPPFTWSAGTISPCLPTKLWSRRIPVWPPSSARACMPSIPATTRPSRGWAPASPSPPDPPPTAWSRLWSAATCPSPSPSNGIPRTRPRAIHPRRNCSRLLARPCGRPGRSKLLQTRAVLFVQHQPVEDGQHLLAINIHALQVLPKRSLEIVGLHPLIEQRPGHVNILAQSFDRVAAQEKSVEKGGFPLRSTRVEIV